MEPLSGKQESLEKAQKVEVMRKGPMQTDLEINKRASRNKEDNKSKNNAGRAWVGPPTDRQDREG